MKIEKELKSEKGSTLGKVKKLKKQYNKILVDLFDQFAAESIEAALEKSQGSFGENIETILSDALYNLRCKVMSELGVDKMEAMVTVGGPMTTIIGNDMDMDIDSDESEEQNFDQDEMEDESDEETENDEDEIEDEEEELEEKAPPGAKNERMVKWIKKSAKKAGKSDKEAKRIAYATAWKKHNESVQLVTDKKLSKARREDQQTLTEAYASIYSEASVFGTERGSPRYGMVELKFESDMDRALYIVTGKNQSKSHQKYVNYLKSNGLTDAEIMQKGADVRNAIKSAVGRDNMTPRTVDIAKIN